MTSEPFAEPTTAMPGPFACTTAGSESPTDTEQTASGKPGPLPDLGSLERSLILTLSHSGIPEEFTADIAQGLTLLVRQWFLEWLESSILDTQKQPIDCKKQPSILISGS